MNSDILPPPNATGYQIFRAFVLSFLIIIMFACGGAVLAYLCFLPVDAIVKALIKLKPSAPLPSVVTATKAVG
ncbi:unnamed protein product [Cutaneotrichosporon oleaginosum]